MKNALRSQMTAEKPRLREVRFLGKSALLEAAGAGARVCFGDQILCSYPLRVLAPPAEQL